MQFSSPNEDLFEAQRAPQALLQAVQDLADQLDQSLVHMEGKTMGQIVEMAKQQYGNELPAFWSNWIDWAREEGPQPMGEL